MPANIIYADTNFGAAGRSYPAFAGPSNRICVHPYSGRRANTGHFTTIYSDGYGGTTPPKTFWLANGSYTGLSFETIGESGHTRNQTVFGPTDDSGATKSGMGYPTMQPGICGRVRVLLTAATPSFQIWLAKGISYGGSTTDGNAYAVVGYVSDNGAQFGDPAVNGYFNCGLATGSNSDEWALPLTAQMNVTANVASLQPDSPNKGISTGPYTPLTIYFYCRSLDGSGNPLIEIWMECEAIAKGPICVNRSVVPGLKDANVVVALTVLGSSTVVDLNEYMWLVGLELAENASGTEYDPLSKLPRWSLPYIGPANKFLVPCVYVRDGSYQYLAVGMFSSDSLGFGGGRAELYRSTDDFSDPANTIEIVDTNQDNGSPGGTHLWDENIGSGYSGNLCQALYVKGENLIVVGPEYISNDGSSIYTIKLRAKCSTDGGTTWSVPHDLYTLPDPSNYYLVDCRGQTVVEGTFYLAANYMTNTTPGSGVYNQVLFGFTPTTEKPVPTQMSDWVLFNGSLTSADNIGDSTVLDADGTLLIYVAEPNLCKRPDGKLILHSRTADFSAISIGTVSGSNVTWRSPWNEPGETYQCGLCDGGMSSAGTYQRPLIFNPSHPSYLIESTDRVYLVAGDYPGAASVNRRVKRVFESTDAVNWIESSISPLIASTFSLMDYPVGAADAGTLYAVVSDRSALTYLYQSPILTSAADQLAADEAEVAANVASILSTATILGVTGTLPPTGHPTYKFTLPNVSANVVPIDLHASASGVASGITINSVVCKVNGVVVALTEQALNTQGWHIDSRATPTMLTVQFPSSVTNGDRLWIALDATLSANAARLTNEYILAVGGTSASEFTGAFPAAVLQNAPTAIAAVSQCQTEPVQAGKLTIYQYAAFVLPGTGAALTIAVVDQDDNPISLAGKQIEIIASSPADRGTLLWKWSTLDASLSIVGADHNVIQIHADATHSQAAGDFALFAWDITAGLAQAVPEASVALTILPAPKPVAAT